jgi:hypothetical protein
LLLSLKKLFKLAKEKLRKLDNERLAIAAVSVVGLGLLVPLLLVVPGLVESEWFLNLLSIFEEYAGFISTGAYIGRLLNLRSARPFITEKQEQKTKVTTLLNKEAVIGRSIGIREKELTPVGMLLGMILAIIGIVLQGSIPFLSVFSYFSYVLYVAAYACSVGGLFNRLGSCMDDTRLLQEKTAILLGAILGLLLALSCIVFLMVTGTLPLVAIVGISKVFFDLFVLHKTFFVFAFIAGVTGLTTSCCDYFTKAYCFLKCKYGLDRGDSAINNCVASRYHEYRGALLGSVTGCFLACTIATVLTLAGCLVTSPFTVGITLFVTLITCSSVTAALCSRIGRLMDGMKRVSKSLKEKMPEKQTLVLVSRQNVPLDHEQPVQNCVKIGEKQAMEAEKAIPKPVNAYSSVHKAMDEDIQSSPLRGISSGAASSLSQSLPFSYSNRVLEIHLGIRPAEMFAEPVSRSRNSNSAYFFRENKENFFVSASRINEFANKNLICTA